MHQTAYTLAVLVVHDLYMLPEQNDRLSPTVQKNATCNLDWNPIMGALRPGVGIGRWGSELGVAAAKG